jgi:outer membrane protein assembly factor BamB
MNYVVEDNITKKEYWVDVNFLKENKILFYDFKNKTLKASLTFPDGFNPIGLFYINSDSIYIGEYDGNRILLADINGKIKRTYLMMDRNSEEILFAPYKYQPLFVSSSIIISGGSLGKGNILNGFYNYPAIYAFDKKSENNLLRLNKEIPFSNKFKTDTVWYFSNASFAVYNENIYVSFANEHNLICYNGNGVREIPAKSKYIEGFLPFERDKAFKTQYIDSMSRVSPMYMGILYDKYRHLFYRIAVHKTPISYDGENITDMGDKVFSIICMDENLRIINETVMPRSEYNCFSMYVCKDGLLIEKLNNSSEKVILQLFKVNIKYKD